MQIHNVKKCDYSSPYFPHMHQIVTLRFITNHSRSLYPNHKIGFPFLNQASEYSQDFFLGWDVGNQGGVQGEEAAENIN